MENLYLNLSEEEFSSGRKTLLWGFAGFFLIGSVYVLITNLILGHKSMPLFIALITFGVSLFVGLIAAFASIKRKNLFFLVDNEKIEFRFGVFKPKEHLMKWTDIREIIIPSLQKKALLHLHDGSTCVINLNWLQKRKSSLIRKHLYLRAKEKNIKITKVSNLH